MTHPDTGSRPGLIWPRARFLVNVVITCGLEVAFGVRLASREHDAGAAETIAVLVIVCFLIGVIRSWELVGGPSFGFFTEARSLLGRARGIGEESNPDS